MTEVEKKAEELAKAIRDAKALAEANGTKIATIEPLVIDIQAKILAVQQAQEAQNRVAFERSVSSSGNRELDRYTRTTEGEVAQNAGCYLTGKTGAQHAVRLVGHDRVGDTKDPVHSTYRVWGLFDDPNPRTEFQREAQRLLDRRNFVVACMNAGREDKRGPKLRAWRCEAELLDHLRSGPEAVARIFADGSGIGAAWIPDNPLPELEREILFRPATWQMYQQVQMARNPILRPYRSGYLRAFKGQIPANDDPAADPSLSTWSPTNQTIEAQEVSIGAQVHRNAEEDAMISFEGEIRRDLVDGTVFGIENARINGDTAATHQDAIASWDTRSRLGTTPALGGSNDQRRLWLGLRPYAYDLTSMTTDASAAAITEAHILADLAKLKVEHLLNSEGRVGVVIECSPESFFGTLISLDEFDAFDNVGVLASVLTGQLGDVSRTPGGLLPGQVGFLFGRFPLIVSYCITKDLASTGLFTGSGSTTGLLTHDVSRFQFFVRRGAMVEVEDDIRNNTRTVVSRTRLTFQAKESPASTVKSVHWRFNTI